MGLVARTGGVQVTHEQLGVGVALVVYLVLVFVHEWLFGVSPMGPVAA